MRYDLKLSASTSSENTPPRQVQWIAKFYPAEPDTARRVTRVLDLLESKAYTARSGTEIPRAVASHEPLHLVLLTYLPGEPLLRLRAASLLDHDYPAMLNHMARALVALHATPVGEGALDRVKTPAGTLAALRPRADELCAWFPAEAARVRAALDRLERGLPAPSAHPALLHGDFGGTQLVWHEGRLGLFDFDKAALGDSALDLANLVVQLRRRALLNLPDAPSPDHLRELLLDAYGRHCADATMLSGLAERVTWHERALLLKKIHFLARHPKERRRTEAHAVLTALLGTG